MKCIHIALSIFESYVYQCVCCVHLRWLHMYNWHLIFQHACIIFIHILLKCFTSFTYWRGLNIVAIRDSLTTVKSIQYKSYIYPICCLYVHGFSQDFGKDGLIHIIWQEWHHYRVTACLSLHSWQANANSQSWSSTAPTAGSGWHTGSTTPSLISAVFHWKKSAVFF